MAKNTMKLVACALAVAIACGCGGNSEPKRTPEILTFAVTPMDTFEGDYRLVSWNTRFADRISLLERTGTDGSYRYNLVFESETMPSGVLEYRVHADLTLVLRAYNVGSRRQDERTTDITTEIETGDHLKAFFPEQVWVAPDECATLNYSIANVTTGMSLHLGIVEPDWAGEEIVHNFDSDTELLHGKYEVADCATASGILKITHHTGFYAELYDESGPIEYAETYVGFFEVPLPEIISFTADDTIVVLGDSTTVRWEVAEADQVELAGYTPQYCDAWGECRGSAEVTPTTTTEYMLTATGPGGSIIARLTVEVTTTPTAPTIVSFTASPTEIRPGTTTTLTWDTTLATSVSIVGAPADSTLPSTFTTDGTAVVSPTATTTYTLTATNSVGSVNDTAVVTVTPLASGDLVISEIMMNPHTVLDTNAEWFEIYNPGSMSANLRGLTIGTGSATDTVDSDVIVAGGGYALLALSSDTGLNDNLPTPDFVYSGLSFDEGSADALTVSDGGTTIDAVAWDGSTWTVTEGYSWSLDPGSLTATGNDSFTNWCSGATMWSGASNNYGTPGAANPSC